MERSTSPSLGILQDGRKYVVYRFLLYADGFIPFTGKKGSMSGCYMLPLGISPDHRTSIGAVRKIALTPPGVSPNIVIQEIVKDIVQGTVEGLSTMDSNNE